MIKLIWTLLLVLPMFAKAQHTFSIVAVDSLTGEIGSAGATCGDSILWPGTPGALLISDIIPGVGAIHTQAYHHATNQANAHQRMLLGRSPKNIINWLVANDVASAPSYRQYGVVDYNAGSPRAFAYTGSNCNNYKNHIIGPNYAIQGNILLGQHILDSMEARFNNTNGSLADKLMAAMQGANVVGADTRCTSEGTSSLSAFLRVAKPNDHPDSLFLDLNIAATPQGVEPIDELQARYDNWKTSNPLTARPSKKAAPNIVLYLDSATNTLQLRSADKKISRIVIHNMLGKVIMQERIVPHNGNYELSLEALSNSIYFVTIYEGDKMILSKKIILRR